MITNLIYSGVECHDFEDVFGVWLELVDDGADRVRRLPTALDAAPVRRDLRTGTEFSC